ncbi:MAG: class I SAM-dependent methyltransferase, partial [Cyanobacteria bacterium]|nr:class I SAM-dependent methyltransferase [Cyanobacteriota bacterium]
TPEIHHDLETFPWPWADSSVDEIVMNHVLEHLGRETDIYFGIIKELYRISKPNGLIRINVPHPRHDDFLNDPTHVRPITPEHLLLFSKKQNLIWQSQRKSNSPLGLYLDVDFEIVESMYKLDPYWENQFSVEGGPQGLAIEGALDLAIRNHNNVVKEIWLDLKVIKPSTTA